MFQLAFAHELSTSGGRDVHARSPAGSFANNSGSLKVLVRARALRAADDGLSVGRIFAQAGDVSFILAVAQRCVLHAGFRASWDWILEINTSLLAGVQTPGLSSAKVLLAASILGASSKFVQESGVYAKARDVGGVARAGVRLGVAGLRTLRYISLAL